MTNGPGQPPAAWYPDPQQPGVVRYWDGEVWTDHIRAAAVHGHPPQVARRRPPTGALIGILGAVRL